MEIPLPMLLGMKGIEKRAVFVKNGEGNTVHQGNGHVIHHAGLYSELLGPEGGKGQEKDQNKGKEYFAHGIWVLRKLNPFT